MYPLIRRIHLFASFVLLVWVILYFATGYLMIHEKWFDRGTPQKTTRTEAITWDQSVEGDGFVSHLERTFALAGKRDAPRKQKDGSWRFKWVRPGTVSEATVSADAKSVQITVSESTLAGLAHGLHRLHGYGGGWIYNLWALVFDLASLSLILFAVTGVFLWWKSTSNRIPGVLCLLAGVGFTAWVMIFLMTAK